MQRLLTISLILGLSCLATASGKEVEYRVIPVSLIVDPGTANLYRRLDRLFRERHYGDVFRAPNELGGVPVVHCAETHRIGMFLRIWRSSAEPLGRRFVRVRYEWTHGELDIKRQHLSSFDDLLYPRRVTTKDEFELQRVSNLAPYEGLWTMRSYIGEELVAEETFNLIDCAGDFAEIDIYNPPSPEELLAAKVAAAITLSEAATEAAAAAEAKAAAKAEGAAAAAAAAALEGEENREVICRKETPTGSHMKVTVCRLRGEIDRRREDDQDFVRDVQSEPVKKMPPSPVIPHKGG